MHDVIGRSSSPTASAGERRRITAAEMDYHKARAERMRTEAIGEALRRLGAALRRLAAPHLGAHPGARVLR
ncbi:MAG: hypothetical protein HY246_11910 [Proteobacteria bacterium]|nr:hypothetical protein [Pseudomonadota bacterium]